MERTIEFGWTLTRGDDEIDVTIKATVTPGLEGTHLDPEEPSEVDLEVKDLKGRWIELNQDEYETLSIEAHEWAEANQEAAREDRWDAERDMRIEGNHGKN